MKLVETVTNVDFLPEKGKILIDTSGIDWVPESEDYDFKLAKIKKINNLVAALKKRGNFFTTEGVLEEIIHSRDHYKSCKSGIKGEIRGDLRYYRTETGSPISATKNNKRKYSEYLKTYNRIIDCLRDGMRLYSPNQLQPNLAIRKYVDKREKEYGFCLKKVDKEIIVTAISAGHGNGILTADTPLIQTFIASVKKFNLKDCFVSDSMNRITYPVLRGGIKSNTI